MRSLFLLVLAILAHSLFPQLNVQYAELSPQLIADNADTDCQTFITYIGTGEPFVKYYIWDSKTSKESPAYSGDAICIGGSWESGKACHSGFFNPRPLSGIVYCAIEASAAELVSGKCTLAARACSNCPKTCGDGKCSADESGSTCPQDCLFYGIEVKVLSPECYQNLHRGESFQLRLALRKEGAPLKGAAVAASGFFGTAELMDDGKGSDSIPGDGIYSGSARVPNSASGILQIDFSASEKGAVEKRSTIAWVSTDLKTEAYIPAFQKLGDVIMLVGNVSSLGAPASGEAVAEFYSPSGKLVHSDKNSFLNGTLSFAYHSTLVDELGNWSVRLNATDEFGNSGEWSGGFALAKLAPGSFLEVEHISPVVGAYSRGSTVSVSARVKKDSVPFSGAQVVFFTPQNQPVEMKEVGSGIYGSPYTILQGDPTGTWNIVVRASATTDSGTIEGGSAYKVNVIQSILRVDIIRPDRAEFAIGENVEIVASAKYPDGEPADPGMAHVQIGSQRIRMEQTQPGTFVAYYMVPEKTEGDMMLTVEVEDSYGNSGSKSATILPGGTSLLYLLDKNRFIVIPAAIALLIAFGTFCRNCFLVSKKQRLLKKKEQMLALQAKLQVQYLKEGSVDRKTFYDLSAKYDSELQQIEHELGESEKGKAETK